MMDEERQPVFGEEISTDYVVKTFATMNTRGSFLESIGQHVGFDGTTD